MAANHIAYINQMLEKHGASIQDEWIEAVVLHAEKRYPGLISETELKQQHQRLFGGITRVFAAHAGDEGWDIGDEIIAASGIRELGASRAKLGFKPADTANYIFMLKKVMTRRLIEELSSVATVLASCLSLVEEVIDRLAILSFESFVETRERIIAMQSSSLIELSTPVVRLWDRVLLLPLVGVIDTARARIFTERMLEAIAHYEAVVTIMDVTGVPVFDTSVARHIIKSVDAAKLLGTRVVITGISPEGAQTLTKLGVSFSDVISRATLRAGIAEALALIGRRVVAVGGGGS